MLALCPLLQKLGEFGFDQMGVDQLFAEMSGVNADGSRRERVSLERFDRYLLRTEDSATE